MKYRLKCILGLLSIGILYFSFLAFRPLANPDEGRYCEIPREMVASGDWIVPRLNGILYFEKPPLFYWLQATAFKWGGAHEWAMRLTGALMAFVGCLLVFGFTRRYYGSGSAWCTLCILALSPLYFALGQIVTLDMTVSTWITAALLSFFAGIYSQGKERRVWLYGFYASMAFATLSKGLIGLLIPCAIIMLWYVWQRPILRPLYSKGGLIIYGILTIPWHVAIALKQPSFLWYYFVNEHFLRYLTPGHCRTQPFWFFVPVLILGFLPWSFFIPHALKNKLTEPVLIALRRFLWVWALFILAFFSLSKSKLIPYVLPAFPALAILCGPTLYAIWLSNPRRLRLLMVILFLVGLGLIGLSLGFPILAPYAKIKEIPPLALRGIGISIGVIIALIAGFLLITRKYERAYLGAVIGTLALILPFTHLYGKYIQAPSTRTLALYLKERLQPQESVFCVGNYYQDLPYYLQKTVGLVYGHPGELCFGLSLEDHRDRYPSEAAFEILWKGEKRLYALCCKARYTEHSQHLAPSFILKEDARYILFSNKP